MRAALAARGAGGCQDSRWGWAHGRSVRMQGVARPAGAHLPARQVPSRPAAWGRMRGAGFGESGRRCVSGGVAGGGDSGGDGGVTGGVAGGGEDLGGGGSVLRATCTTRCKGNAEAIASSQYVARVDRQPCRRQAGAELAPGQARELALRRLSRHGERPSDAPRIGVLCARCARCTSLAGGMPRPSQIRTCSLGASPWPAGRASSLAQRQQAVQCMQTNRQGLQLDEQLRKARLAATCNNATKQRTLAVPNQLRGIKTTFNMPFYVLASAYAAREVAAASRTLTRSAGRRPLPHIHKMSPSQRVII
jgi:hypothetical protein